MDSIGTALANAHVDLEDELTLLDGDLAFQGMNITRTQTFFEPGTLVLEVRAAPAMILFIGSIMALLPSRASVEWRNGWAFLRCPPHEDRDVEDDPTPLVPRELVPA